MNYQQQSWQIPVRLSMEDEQAVLNEMILATWAHIGRFKYLYVCKSCKSKVGAYGPFPDCHVCHSANIIVYEVRGCCQLRRLRL